MKSAELGKIIVALSIPIIFGTPLLFSNVEFLQEWVNNLKLPAFTPPPWVFPLAWTYVFAGMGIGMWMIWEMPASSARNTALVTYAIQFVLNVLWNLSFFYYSNLKLGVVLLLAMWLAIVVMIYKFYQLKPMAAYLNLPYFIWRTYSIPLAFTLWKLNS